MGKKPWLVWGWSTGLAAQDWGHRAISPRALAPKGLCSQSDTWRRRSRKLMVLGTWRWPDRSCPLTASNQMSSHDLEGPTVQPTEGSRRQVDRESFRGLLPLKPGLGTAIHLRGFTPWGQTPPPGFSQWPFSRGSALQGQVGWICIACLVEATAAHAGEMNLVTLSVTARLTLSPYPIICWQNPTTVSWEGCVELNLNVDEHLSEEEPC